MKGYNPYYDPTNRPIGKTAIRFSRMEVQHLGLAVLALTLAFALSLSSNGLGIGDRVMRLFTNPIHLVAAFMAVASGFVFHEIAHKIVAIRYGCMAEFRAQMNGLGFAVMMALFTGWIMAAPGAVQIYGHVSNKENGLISVAGPATNILFAVVALPFTLLLTGTVAEISYIVGIVNAFLAAFNLLPFGPLDGKKVMNWSKPVWGGTMALSILLIFINFVSPTLAL